MIIIIIIIMKLMMMMLMMMAMEDYHHDYDEVRHERGRGGTLDLNGEKSPTWLFTFV